MARPFGTKNKKDDDVEQDEVENTQTPETVKVVEASEFSDKKTTVRGIHECKKPRYDRKSF